MNRAESSKIVPPLDSALVVKLALNGSIPPCVLAVPINDSQPLVPGFPLKDMCRFWRL